MSGFSLVSTIPYGGNHLTRAVVIRSAQMRKCWRPSIQRSLWMCLLFNPLTSHIWWAWVLMYSKTFKAPFAQKCFRPKMQSFLRMHVSFTQKRWKRTIQSGNFQKCNERNAVWLPCKRWKCKCWKCKRWKRILSGMVYDKRRCGFGKTIVENETRALRVVVMQF